MVAHGIIEAETQGFIRNWPGFMLRNRRDTHRCRVEYHSETGCFLPLCPLNLISVSPLLLWNLGPSFCSHLYFSLEYCIPGILSWEKCFFFVSVDSPLLVIGKISLHFLDSFYSFILETSMFKIPVIRPTYLPFLHL
jgi:hypothetical protein